MRRCRGRLLVVWTLCGTFAVAAEAVVRIEAGREVNQEVLTLGALADALPDELAHLRLGYAPYPGHYRWLGRREIEAVLHRAGFDTVRLEMPERVLLTRKTGRLAPERIRGAVASFFENRLPGVRIELQEILLPAEILLPSGEVQVEVDGSSAPRRIDGATLRVNLVMDGKTVRHCWVRIRARVFADVAVTTRDLAYGTELQASDISIQSGELEELDGYVTSCADAVGQTAKRNLPAGTLLRKSDLKATALIRRGDLVTLVGRTSTLTVSTAARARDSGRLGDRVMVQNLGSNQLVEATVIDAGRVEVRVPEIRP